MALLTADDVLNKKFQATKFREGYDQDEVDDFLDEVVNTLRDLQGENEDLKTKLAAAERRIAELSPAGAQQAAPAPKPEPVPEPVPAPAPVLAAPVAPVVAPVVSRPCAAREPESATGMLALAQKLHDDYVRSGQEESATASSARPSPRRRASSATPRRPRSARSASSSRSGRSSSARSTSCGSSSATTARV